MARGHEPSGIDLGLGFRDPELDRRPGRDPGAGDRAMAREALDRPFDRAADPVEREHRHHGQAVIAAFQALEARPRARSMMSSRLGTVFPAIAPD
jgi:hypothetical protein